MSAEYCGKFPLTQTLAWISVDKNRVMLPRNSIGVANRIRVLEFKRFVQFAALRTTGAIHIGVVGINEAAFIAAENAVVTFGGTKAAPT